MVKDVCRWLRIKPGEKKYSKVKFPKTRYKWHFIRGFFDGDGSVRKKKGKNHIDCGISTRSKELRDGIEQFTKIPCNNNDKWNSINWYGNNARSFLKRLYKDDDMYLERKYKTYQDWG